MFITRWFIARVMSVIVALITGSIVQAAIPQERDQRSVPIEEQFPTWKTITLGTGPKTGPAFRDTLNSQNIGFDSAAHEMFDREAFTVSTKEVTVNLVRVTMTDLGFQEDEAPTLVAIYKRAEQKGLSLCPAEVGPQLRLQVKKQKDWLMIIGMDSILDAKNISRIFTLQHTELRTYLGSPTQTYGSKYVFVFMKK